MKADHHQPSARLQHSGRRLQQCFQIVQFTVYEDSESLKGSRRRMNPLMFQFIDRAAAAITSTSCFVVRIGRDRTMALAILRDLLSSPNS